MLTIFRRHTKICPYRSKGRRSYQRCECPIHVEGRLHHDYIRKRLDIANWKVAQAKVREMETAVLLPAAEEQPEITLEAAIEAFLSDAKARHLSPRWVGKIRFLLETQLLGFCAG